MRKYKIRKFRCIGCGEEIIASRPSNGTKYCSLSCYRESKRPHRKTGKFITCIVCGKEKYIKLSQINDINFCSLRCANEYQKRNKIEFICKICGQKFYWSKSRMKNNNPTYCSWGCRIKDKEHIIKNSIKGNLEQQNKKGLNKLELSGRKILEDIGVDFQEQVLMFNKFLVDILLEKQKIIIQWDGEYWHTKQKRVLLDRSQDAYLKECGYNVLRITDKQIKNNIEEVYANITRAIQ